MSVRQFMSPLQRAALLHEPNVEPSLKMDGGDFWVGVCSCSTYQSSPTTLHRAWADARQHVAAMRATLMRPVVEEVAERRHWSEDLRQQARHALDRLDFEALDRVLSNAEQQSDPRSTP